MDRVLLCSRAKFAYIGHVKEFLTWFHKAKISCPTYGCS